MSNSLRVILLCNFFEDKERLFRGISTDSPACSHKVIMMAHALANSKIRPIILSMGRGRCYGSFRFYRQKVIRHERRCIVYSAYCSHPVFSPFVSIVSLLFLIVHLKINSQTVRTGIIAWNRTLAFIPVLLLSNLLGFQGYLDLEDSGYPVVGKFLRNLLLKLITISYDHLCPNGNILSCSHLLSLRRPGRQLVYYGYIKTLQKPHLLTHVHNINFLLCGTLSMETGAHILLDALSMISLDNLPWSRGLTFSICGYGPLLDDFISLSRYVKNINIHVYSRLDDESYMNLLRDSHVGLALKPINSPLAITTFPSKVIEMAGAGLLLLTTDISDVRYVFGDKGAVYLTDNSPLSLYNAIKTVSCNTICSYFIYLRAYNRLFANHSLETASCSLANFFR